MSVSAQTLLLRILRETGSQSESAKQGIIASSLGRQGGTNATGMGGMKTGESKARCLCGECPCHEKSKQRAAKAGALAIK